MRSTVTKAFLLTLALLLLSLSLASCKVTLKPGEDGLYDKQNNVTYSHASTVYEATALVKEYGKLSVTSKESYTLYTLPDTDPLTYLATEDLNILYASDLTMPTLAQMAPSVLHICNEKLEIRRMEEIKTIVDIVNTFTEGDSIPYPGTTPLRSYKARFESPYYPGFFYTLTYIEYADDLEIDGVTYGKYFLYNAFDQVFVPVGDEIHKALGLE